jgi:F-type H+-transporting ATPase subunit delta
VIEELLGDKSSSHTRDIAAFVVAQARAGQMSEIASAVAELAAEAREKVLAEVLTAVELDDETRQKLADALSRATGKQVDVKVLLDPTVVGGFYAKIGDQVIDATIRRRLQELREQLIRVKE